MADPLPTDTKPLAYRKISIQKASESEDILQDLLKIWKEDTNWKLKSRQCMTVGVSFVLLVESTFIFWAIYEILFSPIPLSIALRDAQPLVATMLGASIVQVAYIFKVMVEWTFSDVNYNSHPYSNRKKE